MHIKIDYCYLYYHYLLIAMATIRKLTSDLEKIVLCDDVEKYVKYMVKMKSKHKTKIKLCKIGLSKKLLGF